MFIRPLSQIFVLGIFFLASSCKECKKVELNVIERTTTLGGILEMRPTGQQIASLCPTIIDLVKPIPDGAEAIRALARAKYLNVEDTCLEWRDAWEYHCQPTYPFGTCQPVRYSYCSKWQHSETPLPGYDEAIALSQDIDELYRITQSMCIDALADHFDDAYGRSIAVQDLYKGKISAEQLKFHAAACPSHY
mgnify:CR=1 FL=1